MKLCRACRRKFDQNHWARHLRTGKHKKEHARWEKQEVDNRKGMRYDGGSDSIGSEECLADFDKKAAKNDGSGFNDPGNRNLPCYRDRRRPTNVIK